MEFIAFVFSQRFREQAFYEQGSLPVLKQAINKILSNSSPSQPMRGSGLRPS